MLQLNRAVWRQCPVSKSYCRRSLQKQPSINLQARVIAYEGLLIPGVEIPRVIHCPRTLKIHHTKRRSEGRSAGPAVR